MCFLSGISVYLISIGYITKNYLYSLVLVYPSSLLVGALSYFLVKYTVKNCMYSKFNKNIVYRIYYDKSKDTPWKTSIMLRILLIPVTYKNYVIALMEINFIQFFIPSVI